MTAHGTTLTPEEEKHAIEMRSMGKSLFQIGKTLGYSEYLIKREMIRLGLFSAKEQAKQLGWDEDMSNNYLSRAL